jgi:hypothetical protein
MSITSSRQQQALQEAQVMAAPLLSSVALDSVAISLTMEGQPFARIMLVGAQRDGGVLNPPGKGAPELALRIAGQSAIILLPTPPYLRPDIHKITMQTFREMHCTQSGVPLLFRAC